MGQRLVITVKNNGINLAKIYYHWSAYTVSALMEASSVVNCICKQKNKSEKELQLALIHFCERNGGGISGGQDSDEWEYIQKIFPNETFKSEGINRTYGLIALSENGMNDLQNWSEGDLDIILDEDLIVNYVYFGYDNFEEYKENRSDWDDDFDKDMKLEDVPDIGYDLCEIGFDEIDDVIAKLNKVNEFIVKNGNEIFELIA